MSFTLRIHIKVKSQAKIKKIEKINETQYVVYVKEAPFDGKANTAVRDMLAEHFKVTKDQVDILFGEKAKQKLVEINF